MTKQRSKEWFEERKGRITGSIAGALLGMSPYTTKKKAIQSLTDPDAARPDEFTKDVIFEYGKQIEKQAFELAILETGIEFKECGFYKYKDWLGASPDGVSDDAVLEIKCPWSLRDQEDPQFKSINDQPHYYAQVQIEMLCAKKTHCYFYQYANGRSRIEIIDFDIDWIAKYKPELKSIWDKYLDNKQDTFEELTSRYFEINQEIKDLNEEKKELMDLFKDKTNNQPGTIGNAILKMSERKGTIDYKKALKEEGITINEDKYRKASSKVWTLEMVK